MRTISEFIQEQETGVIGGSDNLVKSYSECAAALSLASCYSEQAMIMEFAAENDIQSLRIVQEAETKQNIFKRAGTAVKNAWGKFWEWFKTLIRKIKEFFVGKKNESIANSLESVDQSAEVTMDIKFMYPSAIVKVADQLIDDLKDVNDFDSNTRKAFVESNKIIDDILKGFVNIKNELEIDTTGMTFRGDGRVTMTVGQFRKVMKEIGGTKMSNKIDSLNKKIDSISVHFAKIVDTSNAMQDQWDETDWDRANEANSKNAGQKAAADEMKKFMNNLTKLYDQSMKAYARIRDDVISQIKKSKPGSFDKKTELGNPDDKKVSESAYLV